MRGEKKGTEFQARKYIAYRKEASVHRVYGPACWSTVWAGGLKGLGMGAPTKRCSGGMGRCSWRVSKRE